MVCRYGNDIVTFPDFRIDFDRFNGLPVVVRPTTNEAGTRSLARWLAQGEDDLEYLLGVYGAVLLRGFSVSDAAEFEAICRTCTPELLDYRGGGSPRSHIAGRIYTSTEYPANQYIPLHCEYSYYPEMPRYIYFFCVSAPNHGGETPIGDMRRVLKRLDPELVNRFQRLGVRYIYNLHDGMGFSRSWQQVFDTSDPSEAEAWLRAKGVEYHWLEDGTLHVELHGPALRLHPATGEPTWGNQAANWHVTCHGPTMAERLRRVYREERWLPKHATFGDGSPIPDRDVEQILAVLAEQETVFTWRNGDIMVLDNHRVAHGRRPFQHQRRVLVAMA